MGDLNDPVLQKISIVVPGEFSEALADAGAGVWLWDIVADRIDVSLGMVALTGMPELNGGRRDEVLAGLIHPEDISKIRESTARLFDGAKNYETLCRMRHSSGHYIWVNTHGTLVRDEEGEPQFLIGIVRIRDELTRAKRDLLHAEEMAKLGNWNVDIASQELFWSEGVYNMLGYEPLSFTPSIEFGYSLLSTEDRETIENIIDDALTTKENFDFRSRLRHANGSEVHVEVRGAVEVGVTGAPVSYYGIIQNITDEIKREQQIRQSQKLEAVGNLTGGIAHDFNNLLAVILGNLEMVQDEITDTALTARVEAAIQATLRGSELTQSMLSFARRAELQPTCLDLNAVVSKTQGWISRTLPENIDLGTSLADGLWQIEADSGSTENALINLILNARDAMPSGGKLMIETTNLTIDEDDVVLKGEDFSPGKYVMLAVTDSGCGISAEILSEVFEPFFTTKAVGEGSGLGLSMVQGFMHQSNGSVQVYSEIGVGTTFKLYFKALGAQMTAPPAEVSPAVLEKVSGRRILVVEDQKEVLEILVSVLEKEGYLVMSARSGDEAKTLFDADPNFHLLLTDIVMPGDLQGPALSGILRKQAPDLQVVFMSGYAREATLQRNELRSDDIRLTKPVMKKDLLAALEKSWSRKVNTEV